jgi:hypothetical protein
VSKYNPLLQYLARSIDGTSKAVTMSFERVDPEVTGVLLRNGRLTYSAVAPTLSLVAI